jgi:hypothetical protein
METSKEIVDLISNQENEINRLKFLIMEKSDELKCLKIKLKEVEKSELDHAKRECLKSFGLSDRDNLNNIYIV